jgi:hypothetical protein
VNDIASPRGEGCGRLHTSQSIAQEWSWVTQLHLPVMRNSSPVNLALMDLMLASSPSLMSHCAWSTRVSACHAKAARHTSFVPLIGDDVHSLLPTSRNGDVFDPARVNRGSMSRSASGPTHENPGSHTMMM